MHHTKGHSKRATIIFNYTEQAVHTCNSGEIFHLQLPQAQNDFVRVVTTTYGPLHLWQTLRTSFRDHLVTEQGRQARLV